MSAYTLSTILGSEARARAPCPSCTGKGKPFSVTRDERGSVGHCFRCGYVETERHESQGNTTFRTPAAPQRKETLSASWLRYWESCRPIRGSIAESYLQARGCVIPPSDGDLRFAAAAFHPAVQNDLPSMVALCTHAVTGAPCSLHFTYLLPDGSGKARVDPARRLLANHRKAGTVIRLWPDEAVTYGLGIAEGIETSLALAHAFVPVWSCIDASNLKSFPVLPGIESLTIGADFDQAGIDAVRDCTVRWEAAEREVHIVAPDMPGTDLADEVKP